jgi:hypothetical protein
MAGILAVLALLAGATVVAVVLGVVGGLLIQLGGSLSSGGADRPVMPSHYASLLQTDPSNYPGYCTECGTANDPDYSVCRNCSSRLPTHRSTDPDRDLESIFESDQ